MVFIVLTIHCAVKPYKKDYINATEALVLLCLFGVTIAVLDENDIYVGKSVGIFFIVAPFVYGFAYLSYAIIKGLYL